MLLVLCRWNVLAVEVAVLEVEPPEVREVGAKTVVRAFPRTARVTYPSSNRRC